MASVIGFEDVGRKSASLSWQSVFVVVVVEKSRPFCKNTKLLLKKIYRRSPFLFFCPRRASKYVQSFCSEGLFQQLKNQNQNTTRNK